MIGGTLRHRLSVQAYTTTKGDRGQAVKTWNTTTANVPGTVEPLNGRKLELARQQVATATHKITMRYLPSLTIENRFLFGTRIFNIGSIVNKNEAGFTHEVLAIEQVTGA